MSSSKNWEYYSQYAKVDRIDYAKGHTYIGRGSKWGNLAVLGAPSLSRSKAVQAYSAQLWSMWKEGKVATADILSLKSATLGCFCYPKLCHGMVIAILLETLITSNITQDYAQLSEALLKDIEQQFNAKVVLFIEEYRVVALSEEPQLSLFN